MRRLLLLVAVALLASACGADELSLIDDPEAVEATYEYVVPAGAGEAYDRGEPLEILPAELEARVGEVIRIRNEDDRGHIVGPFYVGPGETLVQRFASAGVFVGQCTVHPSGQFELSVVE
ncbi:MAG: hypothetical protein HKN46_07080 [Acidimicrobiia bacterium]|nr:hypothetical protein [Acidimicrobiia bacterium]